MPPVSYPYPEGVVGPARRTQTVHEVTKSIVAPKHPPPQTPAAYAPRQVAPPQAPIATAALDPLKIFQKYKWLLGIAAVIGGALGVAAHYTWLMTYPVWKPQAIFEVEGVRSNITEMQSVTADEMGRFIATQARIMTGPAILQAVAENPALQQNAPKWTSQFRKGGTGNFDSVNAARDLEDIVEARPIAQTNLIILSVTYKDKNEATAILKLVRERYQSELDRNVQRRRQETTKSLEEQIRELQSAISRLQTQRTTLIRENQLDSVEERESQEKQAVFRATEERVTVAQDLQSAQSQVENLKRNRQLSQFPDDVREDADRDPVMIDLRGRVAIAEQQIKSLQEQQIGRDHRIFKEAQANLDAARSLLDGERSKVLQRLLDAQIETLDRGAASLQNQLNDLNTQIEERRARLVDITQANRQLTDLNTQISNSQEQLLKLQSSLNEQIAFLSRDTASRVSLSSVERPPSVPAFPQLKVMLPAGVVILTGLVLAGVVLRELIDQRVKGPSDIAMIPRTRLLGWVPDTSEDHAGSGNAETAFRDRSKGIVAESFRQLRGSLMKRIAAANHKAILVMGSLPGSGTTTVVSNLALAFATADKRVLVVDANFRRPNLHRVMGLQESPGLADLLAGHRDLGAVVQATSTPNLDLLSAGSKEMRVFERLSAQSMAELLTVARANYDIILIDVAPAVVAGDAMGLAQKADATVLVVRANAEKRGMVARVRNELADARSEFLGVVVNGVRAAAGGYLKGNIKAAAEYHEGT
ncbi:MAG: polysaccharide biosynthesis tyrosine autokinase [Phycisphaerae bacterium]